MPAWKVARKPAALSFEQAASVPLAGLTAYHGLHDEGELKAGQTALVLAASGGGGSYAVGIAKAVGARVIGTCSGRNVDYVHSLGADEVRDYTKPDYLAGVEVDLVFDCVGGDNTAAGLAALKAGGTIMSIATFDVHEAAAKVGKTGKAFLVRPDGGQLAALGDLLQEGKVKVPRLNEFPFEKAQDAFAQQMSNRTVGKIVIHH